MKMADIDSERNRGDLILDQSDPSITSLAVVDERELLRRQNDITYDTTYSSHIGCRGSIKTKCYVTATCGTTRSDELCCNTACATAITTSGDDELTIYPFCVTTDVTVSLYKELRGAGDSTTESSETSSNSGLTAKTAETTGSSSGEATGTTDSAPSSSSDSGGGSSAPVGAIVGGVLGGLALLTLIGFGLWYIRHKKRQAAQGSNVPPTTYQSPPVSYYQQQQPVSNYQQDRNYQPYHPGVSQVEPKNYSPAPNSMGSPATELPSFNNEAHYPGFR
ncbi:hypothetical protein F53441_6469 [Fusarium austroafricanum]|uniref:Mid2 domain-containing protein n=1 Tax=Fusarium austroafricanum TaxID=2364996 RepID=A0A8H4KHX9_9HYPO|nr:hypothetical protein F53441_6469 [Fusarium austroafricanum]